MPNALPWPSSQVGPDLDCRPGAVNVLVVEDDETIGRSLREALNAASYEITWVRNGEDAFFVAITQQIDLMVLDLGLPGRSGLEVLTALRLRDKNMPVLILSARSEIEDRVAGLRAGADDYLGKPYSADELVARLQALLRRGRPETVQPMAVHDLSIDVLKRVVIRAGRVIEITNLEFSLLELLMRRARCVVSRETMAREVWKVGKRATPIDNVIDVHIGRLRRKIDVPDARPLIHTVRGVGFMLTEKEL